MLDKKLNHENPLFHHSSVPIWALCALCFLFVHALVSIPGGSKGKEESIFIEGLMFFVFTQQVHKSFLEIVFSLAFKGP